ncbi:MAG: c-type cytochrome domain-containing protein [Pirellulaceae bacterium]
MHTLSSRSGLAVWVLLAFGSAAMADDVAEKPITYDDHVASVFKKSCATCHGDGKQEAGLNLASYAGLMKGSGGGEIVVAGRSSASRLIEVLTSDVDGEQMPPDGDRLPAETIALITKWIDSGLRENSGSSVAEMRTLGFTAIAPEDDAGPGAVPTNLPSFSPIQTKRPYPVLALATSPRAPVAAQSVYGAIKLFDPATGNSYGAIEFPEGEPLVLTFSRSGRLLLAAGGKPVQSGSVALYDVATGKRLASVADEPDAIIAADISPDEKLVAIGCTSRLVKLYSTEDGSLKAMIDKHTDWVTAVAFSPDGKYLATADRIGNIHLWDGKSGGVILPLSEHTQSVRALSWRSDSGVVASCGEDGNVVWWDVKDGWPLANKPNAHSGGVLDCRFRNAGDLVTCGRDGVIKIWSAEGNELKKFSLADRAPSENPLPPGVRLLPTRVAFSQAGSAVLAGDTAGNIHIWTFP